MTLTPADISTGLDLLLFTFPPMLVSIETRFKGEVTSSLDIQRESCASRECETTSAERDFPEGNNVEQKGDMSCLPCS